MRIFPRLPKDTATELAGQICSSDVQMLAVQISTTHEKAYFPASGGTRISPQEMEDLRGGILGVVRALGFPEKRCPTSEFDLLVAGHLADSIPIHPGEAARDGFWSFLTCVVLPDVARWRFPDTNDRRRFIGNHARNTLQRLWLRAWVLRDDRMPDDPYHLLRELKEDAMVGIMERTSIRTSHELSRAIASLYSDDGLFRIPSQKEDDFRNCLTKIMQILPVIDLEVSGAVSLRDRIWEIFAEVVDYEGCR